MNQRFTRRSGLSLLELLISLGLLAIITGGIASAMGLGVRLYDRSTTLAATQNLIAHRIRLRALLTAALPPSQIAPFDVSFGGTSTGFAFTTLAARGMAPDAAALRITVTATTDLALAIVALSDDGAETKVTETQLATHISDIRFSYFDETTAPGTWLADWQDPTRLPALVRITAAPGSTPDWPEFTVNPRLGQLVTQ